MVTPTSRRPAAFLDRDGVLNVPILREGRSYAPRREEDFRLYPGIGEAISRLRAAGYLIVVVTNQPDVGAGTVAPETIEAMHDRLAADLPIDRIEVCYDTRQRPSRRLKPAPGMLLDAAAALRIDLAASVMIGDRAGDIEAGWAAGCGTTVFIDRGYTAEMPPTGQSATVDSLGEAVDWVLTLKARDAELQDGQRFQQVREY